MNIIKFENQYISQVVDIHQRELELGVLNFFGRQFLERMYESLLKDNWGFLLMSDDDDKTVVGFVLGTHKAVPLWNNLTFGSIGVFFQNILCDLGKAKMFINVFKSQYLNIEEQVIAKLDKRVELSHFAVKEGYKGLGGGSKLISELELRAKEEGYTVVFTRTHNKRLADYYLATKGAKLTSIVPLGASKSYFIEWKV